MNKATATPQGKKGNTPALKMTKQASLAHMKLVNYILRTNQETNHDKIFVVELRCQNLKEVPLLLEFPNIRQFDLSSNKLKILKNVDSFKDIQQLKLYDNKFETLEKHPRMPNLVNMQYQFNKIQTLSEDCFVGCRNLRELRLDNNRLTNLSYKNFAGCFNMTHLDLSFNKLINLNFVPCLTNLRELYVSHNKIENIVDLSRCKHLTDIDVSYNDIKYASGLKNNASLIIVNLSYNDIQNINHLGCLKKCQNVKIASNQLPTDSLFNISSVFPSMERLDISDNLLDNLSSVLLFLSKAEHLYDLKLSNNQFPIVYEDYGTQYEPKEIAKILSSLKFVDNVNLNPPESDSSQAEATGLNGSRGCYPMRLMTAAENITIKQVENQLAEFELQSQKLYEENAIQFEHLMNSITKIFQPRSISLGPMASKNDSCTPAVSKGNRSLVKSRLIEAIEFANITYIDENENEDDDDDNDSSAYSTESYQTYKFKMKRHNHWI